MNPNRPYQPDFQSQPTGAPQPAKRSHRTLWAVLGGIGVVIVLCCGIGLVQLAIRSGEDKPPARAIVSWTTPASPLATTKPAPKGNAKVGEPVRDGKFEFVVTKVETSAQVGSQYVNKTAQGQFVLITMTVKNIGSVPQTMFDANQEALDPKGARYHSDSGAGIYANSDVAQTWITPINPGNAITGKVVFDVPVGVTLRTVVLHDSAYSGGVKVDLQ